MPSETYFSAISTSVELRLGFLVLAFRLFLDGGAAAFEAFEVGKHQLGFDRLGIRDRIDAAFHVGNVIVFEAAQHIGDGVAFADIGEELVAEPLAFGGAAHQPRDIDESQPRGDDRLRFPDGRDLVQAFVRHRHLADIRLDGAEGIVCRLRRRGLRERVEKGGFADIRQSNDTAFETHDIR